MTKYFKKEHNNNDFKFDYIFKKKQNKNYISIHIETINIRNLKKT